MNLDQQIEFYWQQHLTAKSRSMALVAFGAYMALVKLRAVARTLSGAER